MRPFLGMECPGREANLESKMMFPKMSVTVPSIPHALRKGVPAISPVAGGADCSFPCDWDDFPDFLDVMEVTSWNVHYPRSSEAL